MLIFRLRLANLEAALRFFGVYSEALELKHSVRDQLFRRPDFFSFETPQGGVFLYCHNVECFSMEGGSRSEFDSQVRELKWPAAPAQTEAAPKNQSGSATAFSHDLSVLCATAVRISYHSSALPLFFSSRAIILPHGLPSAVPGIHVHTSQSH
jgi:hypothetical protein